MRQNGKCDLLSACDQLVPTNAQSRWGATTFRKWQPTPVDCVGSWGSCSAACTRTFTVTVPALHGGACAAAHGATEPCWAGQGSCVIPNHPAHCEIEGCLMMPTGCEARPECAGCGNLCFSPNRAHLGWDTFLDIAGLASQLLVNAAYEPTRAFRVSDPTGVLVDAGVVGSMNLILRWRDIQPIGRGQFDWSALEGAVQRAKSKGGTISALIWVTEFAPLWIYDVEGVPIVATNPPGSSYTRAPNVLHPTYIQLYKELHESAAAKIAEVGGVIFLQLCQGSTGDDAGVHESNFAQVLDADAAYKMHSGTPYWTNFSRNMATYLYSGAYNDLIQAGNLTFLLNTQGNSFPRDWAAEHVPGYVRVPTWRAFEQLPRPETGGNCSPQHVLCPRSERGRVR